MSVGQPKARLNSSTGTLSGVNVLFRGMRPDSYPRPENI